MPKIFGIYPTDKQQSTQFLNRINTYLKRELDNDWHCYKIKFSEFDHERCIKTVSKNNVKFILFMGHGRSNVLFGSCAKESSDFISIEAIELNENFYKNENFINSENIEKFKGKILFSLSCFSNRNDKHSLGRNAILKGVKSFVGFGDIPTDYIEDNKIPLKAISSFKGLLVKIIKDCLSVAIKNNYSVQGLVDLIKLEVTREIQKIALSKNKQRHKDTIIELLFSFKDEMKIFGDPSIRVI